MDPETTDLGQSEKKEQIVDLTCYSPKLAHARFHTPTNMPFQNDRRYSRPSSGLHSSPGALVRSGAAGSGLRLVFQLRGDKVKPSVVRSRFFYGTKQEYSLKQLQLCCSINLFSLGLKIRAFYHSAQFLNTYPN